VNQCSPILAGFRPAVRVALLALAAACSSLWLAGCSESNPADPGSRTLTVDASGGGDYRTIQEALTAARSIDVVVIQPGTYTGPGNRNLAFANTSPTVMGAGSRDDTVIDCGGTGRGFYIDGSSSPVIENLVITGGDTLRGAGMYLEGSSVTIRNVRFVANEASYGGGGVYSRNGSPVLEDVLFNDNSSNVEGGGMTCVSSDATLDGVTFLRNGAYGSGGGLACVFSSPEISNCVFLDNYAVFGGGVFCGESSPTITSCTFVENEGSQGSAVCAQDDSTPEIRYTIIAFGQPGDGIFCDGSSPYTTLSCVFGNGTLNEICGSYTTSMLYEDPLLCDVQYEDLTLRADSPCLPENNEWGVRMGAFGEGCDAP